MYDEIAVYGRDIERILSKKDYTDFYLSEYAYYFNELLRQQAMYLRGFLDTSYQDVFDMASYYVDAFNNLILIYLKNRNDESLEKETKVLVLKYKNFVMKTIEKLLNAEISFITPPVSLDHFLININVYLFLLQYAKMIKR